MEMLGIPMQNDDHDSKKCPKINGLTSGQIKTGRPSQAAT